MPKRAINPEQLDARLAEFFKEKSWEEFNASELPGLVAALRGSSVFSHFLIRTLKKDASELDKLIVTFVVGFTLGRRIMYGEEPNEIRGDTNESKKVG